MTGWLAPKAKKLVNTAQDTANQLRRRSQNGSERERRKKERKNAFKMLMIRRQLEEWDRQTDGRTEEGEEEEEEEGMM